MLICIATDINVEICKCAQGLLGYTRTLTSADATAGLVNGLPTVPFPSILSIIRALELLLPFMF